MNKVITVILALMTSISTLSAQENNLYVSVKQGFILVAGVKYTTREEIEVAIKEIDNPSVFICTDYNAPHSVLIDVMDIFKQKETKEIHLESQVDC